MNLRSVLPVAAASLAGTGLVVAGIVVALTAPPVVPAAAGAVPQAPARRTVDVPRPAPPVAPAAVTLPGGPVAAVVATTVRRGALVPPADVRTVGWWADGPALGERAGTLVLAGHVDTSGQGPGVFARLRELRPGQRVLLTGADGRRVAYRVVARRTYPRDRPLPAEVFAPDVAARLALVTCTGTFRGGAYSDTLVVYAVPD